MPGKMTLAEAAAFFGIKPRTLYNWLHDTHRPRAPLRHYKFMGRLYFDKKDLEAYRRNMTEVKT